MRQIRRHTSTSFPRNFLKNQACWPEPPGQARTRSPSHLPGQTVIGTKALSLLFLRRKVASPSSMPLSLRPPWRYARDEFADCAQRATRGHLLEIQKLSVAAPALINSCILLAPVI